MAINLVTKYAKKVADAFYGSTYLAPRVSKDYEFVGEKTLKIFTIQTVPMGNYTRGGSNRYGTPTDIQDIVQEISMTQDRAFTAVVDKGDNSDQNMIKEAGKVMGLQVREQMTPDAEKYGFRKLAMTAGKIFGSGTALSKTNAVGRIADGVTYLDDALVPESGRTLFVTSTVYNYIRLSTEFTAVENLSEKALTKGTVGQLFNMDVVKVPSSYLPTGVNFIILYKNAAIFPFKIHDLKVHKDPVGYSGHLLEGRDYYDLFVIGAKADGVYVDIYTGAGGATVVATPTIDTETGVITCATAGATVKYTLDGTDPRYSDSAIIGTTPTVEVGDVVKAYAYDANGIVFPTAVVSATIVEAESTSTGTTSTST